MDELESKEARDALAVTLGTLMRLGYSPDEIKKAVAEILEFCEHLMREIKK